MMSAEHLPNKSEKRTFPEINNQTNKKSGDEKMEKEPKKKKKFQLIDDHDKFYDDYYDNF